MVIGRPRWGPVVGAGITFLVLGVVIVITGHAIASSAVTALGAEALTDGAFYLLGGTASLGLERARRHFWYCWSRETIQLFAVFSGVAFFGGGALIQSSGAPTANLLVTSLIAAPITVMLNLYWHQKVEAHEHLHEGFSWHMITDAMAAFSVAVAGVVAYITSQAHWDQIIPVVAAVVMLVMSLPRAWRIAHGMWHRRANHPVHTHGAAH